MKKLRYSFIATIILIGFVLNIERVDLGYQADVINLNTFFYVLFGAAIVSIILFPQIRKIPRPIVISGWLAIYLICKVFIFTSRPFIGGFYTFITLSELALLILGILLSLRTAENLYSFESIVTNLNLSDVKKRVLSYEEASEDISREFLRSRRYKIPLSVFILKFSEDEMRSNQDKMLEDILVALSTRYAANRLIRILDKELRRMDLIIEQPSRNRLLLISPETDAKGSKSLASRIEQLSSNELGIEVSCGHASFPDEAVTFDELLEKAEQHYSNKSIHIAEILADNVEELLDQKNQDD